MLSMILLHDPIHRKIVAEAKDVLARNDRGNYTVPTNTGLYPAQWNWDSGFVALGFALLGNVGRGIDEIASLLRARWSNGMVPHIVFHEDDSSYFPNSSVWQAGEAIRSSGIAQPPVLATFLRLLVESDARQERNPQYRAGIASMIKPLYDYHRWYHTYRVAPSGAIFLTHPWESGFDNNQAFDDALRNVPLDGLEPYSRHDNQQANPLQRPLQKDYDGYIALLQFMRERGYDAERVAKESPFRFADVGVNSFMVRADRDMLDLFRLYCMRLSDETARSAIMDTLTEWHRRGTDALKTLWNDEMGQFCSVDLCTGRSVELPAISGLMPLFALRPLPERQLIKMAGVAKRWLGLVRYGFPSFDPAHALFEPKRYCRGPAWLIWSWFVADGLRSLAREEGYSKVVAAECDEVATKIMERCLELVRNNGFWEYYDPNTGEGCGGRDFSWTAAAAIMIACELEKGR